jgi:Initiator Replication protein
MSDLKIQDERRPAIKTPQELVHIKHKITLLQYKYWVLMLRTYREAYEGQGRALTDDEYCYLPMDKLAEHLGYEPKTSEIEKDLEAIRKEPIIFNVLQKDGQKGKSGRGFISEWYVSSNRVGVIFPPIIRAAIENLDNRDSIFHLLNWRIFNSFTGKYEALLYKLCKDYLGAGRTPYLTIERFREYMGVKESDYPDFKRLNQWVISGPIKRINDSEISDIVIEAEFKREIRKVIGLSFHVKHKKQTTMDFGDDPAFRFAKVAVALAQQRQYLATQSSEMIELSIQRANEYAEDQEKKGTKVNFGALYRKAIEEDWGKEYQSKKIRESEKQALAKKMFNKEAELRQSEIDKDTKIRLRKKRIKESREALTKEQFYALIDEYRTGEGSDKLKSYRENFEGDLPGFKEAGERIAFNLWLGQKLVPDAKESEVG